MKEFQEPLMEEKAAHSCQSKTLRLSLYWDQIGIAMENYMLSSYGL